MGKTLSIAPKRSSRSPRKKQKKSRWHLHLGLGLVVLALFLRLFFIQTFRVPSRSMEDSLLVGDYLLVDKITYGLVLPLLGTRLLEWHKPQVGAMIIFRYPPDPRRIYVKRCAATAGQQVEIRNKVIYVEGERLIDPAFSKYLDVHIIPATKGPRDNWGPARVPEGNIFVIGDNRDNSRDSRHWGFLPLDLVVGKAVGVYWSCRPALPNVDEEVLTQESWFEKFQRLSQRIRWQRLGMSL